MNLSRNTTLSSCYVAMKHIFPEVPVNGGAFRPTTIHHSRSARVLSAEYPTAVGGYLEVLGRVIDVVFGALRAGHAGAHAGRLVRHDRRVHGRRHAIRAPATTSSACSRIRAATAARRRATVWSRHAAAVDGQLHVAGDVASIATRCASTISALREDSGGAGWHRGGCGTEYQFTSRGPMSRSRCSATASIMRRSASRGGKSARAEQGRNFARGDKTWHPPLRSKYEKQPSSMPATPIAARVARRRRLRRSARARYRSGRARSQSRLHEPRHRRARLRRGHRRSRAVGERTRYRLDADATQRNAKTAREATEPGSGTSERTDMTGAWELPEEFRSYCRRRRAASCATRGAARPRRNAAARRLHAAGGQARSRCRTKARSSACGTCETPAE